MIVVGAAAVGALTGAATVAVRRLKWWSRPAAAIPFLALCVFLIVRSDSDDGYRSSGLAILAAVGCLMGAFAMAEHVRRRRLRSETSTRTGSPID